jgi:hypothetical protein
VGENAMTKKIWWNYDENIEPVEWIKRICVELKDPLSHMYEMDGDMYMSDYSKLVGVFHKVTHVLNELEPKKKGKPREN